MTVLVRQILNSEFVGNIGKLFAGKSLVFALTLGTAPIIARLYTPDDYGVIGVFIAISSIATVLATLKYDNAILLPGSDEKARQLCRAVLKLIMVVSFIVLLVVAGSAIFLTSFEFVSRMGPYLWALPVGIALQSIGKLYDGWLSRHKEFGRIATADIALAGSSTGVRIGTGLVFGSTVLGLLAGLFTGLIARWLVVRPKARNLLRLTPVNWHQDTKVLKEYAEFPDTVCRLI